MRKNRHQELIIFDSPDGTGKTHIAQELSRVLGIPYFRMDTQHDNWRKGKFKTALEFDQTYISSFLEQTGHSAIFDRAYPSEFVYSAVYGRETNIDVLRQVDERFARMGAVIVIPLRWNYADSREDEVVARSELPKIHEWYLNFMRWTRCRTVSLYVDELDNNLEREMDYLLPKLLNGDGDIVS